MTDPVVLPDSQPAGANRSHQTLSVLRLVIEWDLMFSTVRVLADSGPVRVVLARWQDRLVVIKSLKAHSPFLVGRIQREADVLTKLEHENIVPLLGVEEDAIIYAYYPGVNLAEALEQGPIPLSRSLKIVGDVLSALAYAHRNDVIHCDVKPSNILVRGEKALLADFGFAKDLALTAITEQDVMLGTPSYMAPEQFRGERNDPRSDLYAAGAVLYSMLHGSPPYGGNIIRFLVGDTTVELEPLPDEVSSVAPVIYQALSRLPDERYQSAEEMLDALSIALAPA